MKLRRIKELVEERRTEKNEVSELLSDVRKIHGDPDLVNALQLRMNELNSFIQVIRASLESDSFDETFYRDHVGQVMYLLEERYDELQVMVDALIKEKMAKQVSIKAVA
jgi:hypothetical protein